MSYLNNSICRILLGALTLASLTACPNKKDDSPKTQNIIRVKGNPIAFVKGTAMKAEGFPEDMFVEGSHWDVNVSGFEEEPQRDPKKNIEQGNEAPDVIVKPLSVAEMPTVHRRDDGTIEMRGRDNERKYLVEFITPYAGQAGLFTLEVDRVDMLLSMETRVLHTSYTEAKDAFSILVFTGKPGGRQLLNFTFTRTPEKLSVLQKIAQPFYYIFGKGVKVGWRADQPLKLTSCGNLPAQYLTNDQLAVAEWSDILRGRLDIEWDSAKKCPPFSDLRTHTINYIRDWIEISGDQMYAAWTSNKANINSGKMIDADVFILLQELQESLNLAGYKGDVMSTDILEDYTMMGFFKTTMVHELGHVLGLHHQFEKGTPSVMSYEPDGPTSPADYDRAAVQELYPLKAQGTL